MCDLKVLEGTDISSVNTGHGVVDRDRQGQQRTARSRKTGAMSGGGGRQRAPMAAPRVSRGEDEPLTASADSPGLGNRPRSLSFPSASFKRGAGSSGKIQVFLPQASGSPPTRGCAPLLAADQGGYICWRGTSSSSFQSRAQTDQLCDLWQPWGGPGARPRPAGQAACLLGCWAPWTGRLASCWTVMPLPL